MAFEQHPGYEIVACGLEDLRQNKVTVESLLVSMVTKALADLGFEIPGEPIHNPEIRLYEMLGREFGDDAHGRYNSLQRRLTSFLRTSECAH